MHTVYSLSFNDVKVKLGFFKNIFEDFTVVSLHFSEITNMSGGKHQ